MTPDTTTKTEGRRRFAVLWVGQTLSLLGTGMSQFGLGVWVYQATQSATLFSLILLVPTVVTGLLVPIAGVLTDRYDRKTILLICNSIAIFTTTLVAVFYGLGKLEIWHVYVADFCAAACSVFYGPAFLSTARSLLGPSEIDRGATQMQLGEAMGEIGAPVLGALFLPVIGLGALLFLDVVGLFLAWFAILVVRIPLNVRREIPQTGLIPSVYLREFARGMSVIRNSPGLRRLFFLTTYVAFLTAVMATLVTPYVLAFGSLASLSQVVTASGMGAAVGVAANFRFVAKSSRANRLLYGLLVMSCALSLGGAHATMPVIMAGAFCFMAAWQVASASALQLWLHNVEPSSEGRVFSALRFADVAVATFAYLAIGPLADQFFRPAMQDGGALAESVGRIVGVGPERGFGLMLMLVGLGSCLVLIRSMFRSDFQRLDQSLADCELERVHEGTETIRTPRDDSHP